MAYAWAATGEKGTNMIHLTYTSYIQLWVDGEISIEPVLLSNISMNKRLEL